jgi:ABC-type phosphate transport system substrate-binding protein
MAVDSAPTVENSFRSYCHLTTSNVTLTTFTAGGGGLSIPAVEGLCTDQDIGAMSRPWLDSEDAEAEETYIYQCEIGGSSRSAVRIDVAIGALVVVVRKGTMDDACLAKLPGLTMAQLRAVFSSSPTETLPTFAD